MLCCVALVRTDVSEEFSASIIMVTRIGELGTTLAVTNNRSTSLQHASLADSPIFVTLMMEAIRLSETSVLTRAALRNMPEEGIPETQVRSTIPNFPPNNPVCVKLCKFITHASLAVPMKEGVGVQPLSVGGGGKGNYGALPEVFIYSQNDANDKMRKFP
jgi:hypothetical protein